MPPDLSSEQIVLELALTNTIDMDNQTGAQVHNAQSHSSAVEQSEDAAHDVPMAGGVGSAVEVPTTNIVGASAAEPFRFGTMAQGLFNWRKRNASTQLNEVRIL